MPLTHFESKAISAPRLAGSPGTEGEGGPEPEPEPETAPEPEPEP